MWFDWPGGEGVTRWWHPVGRLNLQQYYNEVEFDYWPITTKLNLLLSPYFT